MRRSTIMHAQRTATGPRALLLLQRHCKNALHMMQQDAQPARLHALHRHHHRHRRRHTSTAGGMAT
jgi:hypothetical protein